MFVTPNRLTFGRPDEIIDPYHYVEFDSHQLRTLAAPCFSEVELRGLFGSERYLAIVAEQRETLDRLLARDPLRLRRLVPRRLRQRLYDGLLRHHRKADDPREAAITSADFDLRAGELEDALDLCAICRAPTGERG